MPVIFTKTPGVRALGLVALCAVVMWSQEGGGTPLPDGTGKMVTARVCGKQFRDGGAAGQVACHQEGAIAPYRKNAPFAPGRASTCSAARAAPIDIPP